MSVESSLMDWWNSSSIVTGLVTGGLWREAEPELGEDQEPVEMPFARFEIISETPTEEMTRTPNAPRDYLEDQTLQVDIFAHDPLVAKQARDAARDLLDRWQPVLQLPDIFMSITRSNAWLVKDPVEDDGVTVWHAGLEYVVTLERKKNG